MSCSGVPGSSKLGSSVSLNFLTRSGIGLLFFLDLLMPLPPEGGDAPQLLSSSFPYGVIGGEFAFRKYAIEKKCCYLSNNVLLFF